MSNAAHDSLVYACVQYLELNGIRAYAINQVSHSNKHGVWRTPGAPIGFPDIVAVHDGHAIFVECKTGKSKPRADQIRVMDELKAARATVVVVTSVDQLAQWWS